MALSDSAQSFQVSRGEVIDYSSARGVGTVSAGPSDNATHYLFHCTSIADGTREIPSGASVTFRILPVGPGTFEAVDVQPVGN